MRKDVDFLIIGAGIIGLFLAKNLKNKYPTSKILIIEKESDVALHSSGRNSGVLHAGFYYTANSLKAKFTKDGNAYLTQYCKDNKLSINECKKVVVTKDESELEALYELKKRGDVNGVELQLIDEKELFKIDSNAKTFKHALYSPTTATIDPTQISKHLKNELLDLGVEFYFDEGYCYNLGDNLITTTKNRFIKATKIINTAGLYADRIANDFGFSKDYMIVPFKGVYLKYDKDDILIKTNIYPVPDLNNPFLGVHYTITVDNSIKIGPTAIPAFWRENYQGFANFSLKEFLEIIFYESKLFLTNSFSFRKLAFSEMKKYHKNHFISLASYLTKEIDKDGFKSWTHPGIRAQLLDKNSLELLQDFVVEGDKKSIHILNAVSPAFTSSYPFTKWVVEEWID